MARLSLRDAVDQAGIVSPDAVAHRLKITKAELASVLGLSRDAVSRKNRQRSVATQRRLHEIIDVLDRVLPWAGSECGAYAWYRSQTLSSFGNQTAEDVVKAGRIEAICCYLERTAEGGFA
jgi:DNA-binding Xre family transcriptional regulator